MRVLCLHSFRTSGAIFKAQMAKASWPAALDSIFEMVFLDAPFPATGKSDVEEYFGPPYYEWWAASHDYGVYAGFEESVAYVSDYVKMHGPFQGFIAFSQGAMLTSSLLAMRQKGSSPPDLAWPRFCILIGGSKPRASSLQTLFDAPLHLPSLHLIAWVDRDGGSGDKDFLRQRGEALAASFHHPLIMRHSFGHIVPRLGKVANANTSEILGMFAHECIRDWRQSDDAQLSTLLNFIADQDAISMTNGGIEKPIQ